MRIGMRLLLGYFLIVAVAAWFVLNIFLQEIKPGVRRATESTLVDTASLLAEFARQDLLSGNAQQGLLAQAFSRLNQQPISANISGMVKQHNDYRLYLTDAQGKVLFDSAGEALGADYSRWNDVWLTLRGQYGARSTRSDPDDDASSTMYVAAPVRDGDRIIGVVSLGKPNSSMAAVIHGGEQRVLWAGAVLLGIALLIGIGFVWWINRSVGRLVSYADAVTAGEPTALPRMDSSELRKLAQALETMRLELEGKSYIEQYVYALTHELKSPLAAIAGAAEILQQAPPSPVVSRFSANILQQNQRMQLLIDTMLRQAKLESRATVEPQQIDVAAMLSGLIVSREVPAQRKQIALKLDVRSGLNCYAERLLLEQALGNLLDNALDFTAVGGEVVLRAELCEQGIAFIVEDNGSGIPDFALARIFERFYSLARADGQKSSGLGLAFVREVARLHQGAISLDNRQPQGVAARLTLPK
ncbi:two-component system sensor histidine kinase CreC [Winslowiella iniecta]|uniref:histidine kinase n=1 Tax=Winslowiella iniecta TaxID=1560201 RepID=A0A0L7TE71_9GAMM|nr:two-component system sensor histidine kinase CreC [Winslowiella iniecta]KOC89736.1 histidine kinase [Winslowiella iniecta]KOC93536.1 histidine kinase [Winslowiella iniecta]